MNRLVLTTLPAALSLALSACNVGGASEAPTGPAIATDDTKYLTITSAQDGSKRHIAIPAEPAEDFGDPASPVDEDVGMQGYTDGVQAIKALAADAATGMDPGQAFSEIATQTALSSGSNGPYAPVRLGSILLAVWYQRDHPGTSFADAATALEQSQPDIRKIKKAAHVARLWLIGLAAQPEDANNAAAVDADKDANANAKRDHDEASYAAVNDMFRNDKVVSVAAFSDALDNMKHQYAIGDLTPERLQELVDMCIATSLQVEIDHDRVPSALPLYRPDFDRVSIGCEKTVSSYADAL